MFLSEIYIKLGDWRVRSRAMAAYRLCHPWNSPARGTARADLILSHGYLCGAEEKESETVEIKILAVLYIYGYVNYVCTY